MSKKYDSVQRSLDTLKKAGIVSQDIVIHECSMCGCEFSYDRAKLGYKVCLKCGEKQAKKVKHCVAPMHKSNYMVFTNYDDLKGINNKGGLIK